MKRLSILATFTLIVAASCTTYSAEHPTDANGNAAIPKENLALMGRITYTREELEKIRESVTPDSPEASRAAAAVNRVFGTRKVPKRTSPKGGHFGRGRGRGRRKRGGKGRGRGGSPCRTYFGSESWDFSGLLSKQNSEAAVPATSTVPRLRVDSHHP